MIYDEVLDTEIEYEKYPSDEDIFDDVIDDSNDSSENDDELELKKNRFLSQEGMYRFFRTECNFYEFNRTPICLYDKKDDTSYKGIVVKEMDKTHFIFLLENCEKLDGKKMKKMDIKDISVYF